MKRKTQYLLLLMIFVLLICVSCKSNNIDDNSEQSNTSTSSTIETLTFTNYPPLTTNQKNNIETSIALIKAYLNNELEEVNAAIIIMEQYAEILDKTNTANSFEITVIADNIKTSCTIINACEKNSSIGDPETLRVYYDRIIMEYELYKEYSEE